MRVPPLGDPPAESFKEAAGLFEHHRYLDLRHGDSSSLQKLVDAMRQREVSMVGQTDRAAAQFDRIVGVLVDGNDEQRAATLHQVIISKTIDRPALAVRLQAEIREHFSPRRETEFASAKRDPKLMSSIRSWLISSLIWTDSEALDSRKLILVICERPSSLNETYDLGPRRPVSK